MIRLSVFYPATAGSTFDWKYYLDKHVALAHRLLDPRGMVKIEIDRGVSGFPPGAPILYHTISHLFFRSMDDLGSALAATAPELIGDVPNYYSGQSAVQVSEVV